MTLEQLAKWRASREGLTKSPLVNAHDQVHLLANQGDGIDGEKKVDAAAYALKNGHGSEGLIYANTLSSNPAQLFSDDNIDAALTAKARLDALAAINGKDPSQIKSQADISSLRVPDGALGDFTEAFGGELPKPLEERKNNAPKRRGLFG